MARRPCLSRLAVCAVIIYITVTIVLLSLSPHQEDCQCDNAVKREVARRPTEPESLHWGPHKLAVIVPFRDRFDELLQFAPHMHRYLNAQRVRHQIYVINQVDHLRFNRAALINIGFLQSQTECDYIAMHDVDLLPVNPHLNYSYPANGAFHVSAPELHPEYHYKNFVGGILLLNNEHYKKTNGLTNKFWGWGREDDEFYVRMKEANIPVIRPQNITTGYSTFKHIHNKWRRPRDNIRYWNQKKDTRKRDRVTGLDTVQFTVINSQELIVDGATVRLINVELQCEYKNTPWCVTPDQLQKLVERGEIGEDIYMQIAKNMGMKEEQVEAMMAAKKSANAKKKGR